MNDDVLPKLVCFSLSNFVKIMYFVFTPSKKLKLSDHMCIMHTLHSDEVVSLISGDESVVISCSPMQWMLHYTAIPAIIIIMRCYKTIDLY